MKREIELDNILTEIDRYESNLKKIDAEVIDREEGKDILLSVLQETQHSVAAFISNVVTELVQHVFGPEYTFHLVASTDRDRNATTPMILKGDVEVSLREEVGGGVLDVVSTGFRFAHWAIAKERTAPIFILDEPGKFLDSGRQVAYGEALVALARSLGIQLIYVTHSEELAAIADMSYTVSQRDGVSTVVNREGDDSSALQRQRVQRVL